MIFQILEVECTLGMSWRVQLGRGGNVVCCPGKRLKSISREILSTEGDGVC